MALDVGELVATVSADERGFKKGLDKGRKDFGEFGQSLKRNAKLAGLAIMAGLAYGIKGAIDKASDLAETQSKVVQIFGKSSDSVFKFAETADLALGQSKQQALDAASTFAIFGKGAGLAGKPLVDFSLSLNGLASDLASFYNKSPEEAIVAIGAALRGESEPIRQFGVLLDDATLRQEALRLGLVKTTKTALTPQQRVLAAQAAIMKQTKVAQGDFARTSKGLANQSRILKARLDNMQATIGQKLLPVTLKIVTAFGHFLDFMIKNKKVVVPVLTVLGTMIGLIVALTYAIKAWIAVQIVIDALMNANPVGLVILAIGLLVAGIIILWKRSETFRTVVKATWAGIKAAVSATVGWITGTAWPALKAVWDAIAAAGMWLWHNVFEPVGHGIAAAISMIIRIVTSLYNLIAFVVGPPLKGIWFVVSHAVRLMWFEFKVMWKVVQPILRAFGAVVVYLWKSQIKPTLTFIWKYVEFVGKQIKAIFGKVGEWIGTGFDIGVAQVKAALNGIIWLINESLKSTNALIRGVNKIPGVDFPQIPLIPKLARGGAVTPTAGGRLVRMGDGGEVEYGIPQSKLLRLLGAVRNAGGRGDGGTITIIIKGDGIRTTRKQARIAGGNRTEVPILIGAASGLDSF